MPSPHRTRSRPTPALAGLFVLLGALAACTAKAPPAPADAAQSAPDTAARPAGLPADINAPFLAPDLAVGEWVERFEGESRAVYVRRAEIVAALGLKPGMAIADVGAGTGFFTALFDRAVGADGRVYAVEISPGFLAHLGERAAREGLAAVVVVEGTARSVELPPGSIDVAFLCDVYHHFEHPEATLASLRRALRPGGTLVLIDFERIPGVASADLLEHVRAGREVFSEEIVRAGFRARDEIRIEGLDDNYVLRFTRSD